MPITKPLTKKEIQNDYELNTGKAIVKRFARIDPMQMQAALVANHGPFTWGKTAGQAVEAMVVLEKIATMAMRTLVLRPKQRPISKKLLDKHYLRKHGEGAYYGQEHKKQEKTKNAKNDVWGNHGKQEILPGCFGKTRTKRHS